MPEVESAARPAAVPVPPDERELLELRRRLVGMVRHVTPPWLAGHTEDIVQAAMIRLVEAGRKSGGKGPFASSYLFRTAYSAAVDEMRRHFRRQEVSLADRPDLEQRPAPGAAPDSERSSARIDEAINDCLLGLARPRRLAVTLHLQGYSAPEAGRVLGWTTKKAEHLIGRGMAGLRLCLTSKGIRP